MTTKGSGSTYIVSRALEEPIEATFELGEDISRFSKKLQKPVWCGLLVNFFTILLFVPSLYYFLLLIMDITYKRTEITNSILIQISVFSVFLILLIALIITSTLYLIQVNKFYQHLIQRYSLITDLKSQHAGVEKKQKTFMSKVKDKSIKNPIMAMLDLVEESMHEMPQIIRLIRFCIYFISTLLGLLFIIVVTNLAFGYEILIEMSYFQLGVCLIACIICIPTLIFLFESDNIFMYLQSRHEIIDSVRFGKQVSIPTGKSQLERLIKYLSEHDPYIKSSITTGSGKFEKDVELKDRSGKTHKFNAYFSDNNYLRERSLRLGIPKGKFSVFIKVFDSKITLEKLKKILNVVTGICESQDTFPLRIIILQKTISDLDDEVYEYVLENPVCIKNSITHLQIIAEDEDVYSFIPVISYGKEAEL